MGYNLKAAIVERAMEITETTKFDAPVDLEKRLESKVLTKLFLVTDSRELSDL